MNENIKREDSLRPSVSTGAAPSEREPDASLRREASIEGGGPLAVEGAVERTTAIIGAEIRTLSVQCNTMRVQYAIEIGRRLCEAKELCRHGEWLVFLKNETEYSQPKASRLMQIYRGFAADQGNLFGAEPKYSTLNNLSISNALKLLELPEEERESFALEHDAENLSARDLEALVKERTVELERKAQRWEDKAGEYASTINDLQNDVHDLKTDLEEAVEKREKEENARAEAEKQVHQLRKELEEAENRPQAVAYERDELAIAEAVQAERERLEREQAGAIAKAANDAADAERAKHSAAEKDYKKSIKELKDQIKKAEEEKAETGKRLEELTRKAAEAEKSGRETEGLERQIETLKKQLALAAPEVAAFKAAFDRAQDELGHVTAALHQIQDTEIKEKLRKASLAMLAGFQERVSE